MKTEFLKVLLVFYRFFVICLAWLFSAIYAVSGLALYRLKRLMVSRDTRDIFDGKKTFKQVYGPLDYRQKLIDLLNAESEPIIGYIRELIETTVPGRLAVRYVSDRHAYAVLVPTKAENIQRILSAFDAYPKDAFENAYRVVERAVRTYHFSGVSKDE